MIENIKKGPSSPHGYICLGLEGENGELGRIYLPNDYSLTKLAITENVGVIPVLIDSPGQRFVVVTVYQRQSKAESLQQEERGITERGILSINVETGRGVFYVNREDGVLPYKAFADLLKQGIIDTAQQRLEERLSQIMYSFTLYPDDYKIQKMLRQQGIVVDALRKESDVDRAIVSIYTIGDDDINIKEGYLELLSNLLELLLPNLIDDLKESLNFTKEGDLTPVNPIAELAKIAQMIEMN